MRPTCSDALAAFQALKRNASDVLLLVSWSDTLGGSAAGSPIAAEWAERLTLDLRG